MASKRKGLSREDGWSRPEQASGGEILPWSDGKMVEGTIREIKKLPDRDGKSGGHIVRIETTDGPVVYGLPALLLPLIEPLPLGTQVRILCLGQVVKTRRGQAAWDFEVQHKPGSDVPF